MTEEKETTVLNTSVGADAGQPNQNLCDDSLADSLEEYNRYFRQLNDPSYLPTVSMRELYETAYESKLPLIDGLLFPGTYLLVGAPKLGTSFLAAQLAYHVSTGTPLWNYPVRKGTVLYLALEDDNQRLQSRLYQMFDMEIADQLYFATRARQLGKGLDEQLERFVREHPDTGLIIIDTLQKVREIGGEAYSYASDYDIITRLKSFADCRGLCLILVHHTRKSSDDDPFNMISGSTGLSGCVDGSMVRLESKRGSRKAVLHCIGRDIENREIELQFDSDIHRWIALNEPAETKEKDNPFLSAVFVYMQRNHFFIGTASELIEALKSICDEVFYPNRVTRELILNGYELEKQGIKFEYKRTHRGRKIILQTVETAERDSSDSKNIAVTTVALPPVKSLSSPFNA